MIGYVQKFEGSTTMSFNIGDEKLLESTFKYGKHLKNFWK